MVNYAFYHLRISGLQRYFNSFILKDFPTLEKVQYIAILNKLLIENEMGNVQFQSKGYISSIYINN